MNTLQIPEISFANRRDAFFTRLENLSENSIAIIPAHSELIRNDDVHFKFRADSSFYYLTGFTEPEAIAVFKSVKGKRSFTLFVQPKDLEKEIWTGYRAGVEGAVQKFGANEAFSIEDFDRQMTKLFTGAERVYYSFFRTLHRNGHEYLDTKILRLIESHRSTTGRSGKGTLPMFDVREIIGEMRIYKSPEEIARLRKAGKITAKAHLEAMMRCKPGIYEYQIEALIEYIFKDAGSERAGYNSIVAGGHNATILHYVENNKQLKAGDLFLIDAGTEVDFYTADITRTFAVDGKMNPAQKEIYQIVLDVQKECIRMAKPGVTLAGIHQFATEELTDAMIKLKFLSGDRKKLIENLEHKRYYPHGTGHLLGMDVHDIGLYQVNGEPRKLEPGMCFTIEPGFYVLFDDVKVPEKYRGIGVRIEDDVVITPTGCEVLTSDVPKEISEMQNIVGTKPWLSF